MTKKFLLIFPRSETEKPIIYHLVKDFDLIINIFRAKVTPEEEGYLVLDITGRDEDVQRGIAFVRDHGITINEGNRGVRWESGQCTQCGSCVPHCPTKALHIKDRSTMEIGFAEEECVECLSCVKICPFKACTALF
jgi:ferredoxin